MADQTTIATPGTHWQVITDITVGQETLWDGGQTHWDGGTAHWDVQPHVGNSWVQLVVDKTGS